MPLRITMQVPRRGIDAALEGLVQQNLELADEADRLGHAVPQLYAGGLKYRREPEGEDHWATWTEVVLAGWGDCEDLVGYRVMELRRGGELDARGTWIPTSRPGELHAVVQRADGQLEDPSRVLINQERDMHIQWQLRPLPGGGWQGSILLPIAAANIWANNPRLGAIAPRPHERDERTETAIVAKGKTKAEALGLAARIARVVLSDDVLMALLPPGAGVALEAAQDIADSIDIGDAAGAVRKYAGPALRRLAEVLAS